MDADDLCLLAPSIYALQNMINICNQYVNHHNITFIASKTVCMELYVQTGSSHRNNVLLGENKLSWVEQFDYLGYRISNNNKN